MKESAELLEMLACRLSFKHRRAPRMRQLAPFLMVIGLIVVGAPPADAQGAGAYHDDTHEILNGCVSTRVVSGDFGYDTYLFDDNADGQSLALDVRSAGFVVANSRNPNPTLEFDCENGSLPVNTYPFKVYDPDLTSIVGGIIRGEIPQESDWKPTYCNSAAMLFKRAPASTVDGVRITSAWDGVRANLGSDNMVVKNSWFSNVRDDAVENDDFLTFTFEDNLVDGAFQGISVHSGGDITQQSAETIHIYGSVIKIREYLYKGGQRFGALFKNEESSPQSVIHDTVVAVDYRGGDTWGFYWDRSWSKIRECSNNVFLWLSDDPIPSSVPMPPACFTVLTGSDARTAWAEAKRNWIDCHPKVARTATDPVSNPARCVPDTYGGYSRQTTVAQLW